VPIYYQEIIGLRTIKEFETIVYDLTIEDCHEYFANGILVHNCDPTSLVKLGLQGNNLYCECLLYEPIDNAPALSEVLFSMESKGLQQGIRITADCSDKYNDTEMVKELKNLGHNICKVNKGKGISWRIGMLKKHKIHLVRNVNFKREQENYKWREINGICVNEPIDKFNHCFEADTEILTTTGIKKIIDIKVGDFILNSFGVNKVLASFQNGCAKIWLYRFYFSTFVVEIKCTDNHKFKTQTGWKQANQLQKGDVLYLSKNLMVKNITYIQKENISVEAIKDYILLFGNFIMVKFQKVMKFIIKMKIHSITILKIWNLFFQKSINHITSKKELKKILTGIINFIQRVSKLQKNGIHQKKEENGIKNKQKKQISGILLMDKEGVLYASNNSLRKAIQQNSVPINANLYKGINQESIMSQQYVNGVDKNIQLINTNSKNEKDFVQEVVLLKIVAIPIRLMDVYELTVQENHEYFANGILVHNCWDATGYGYIGSFLNSGIIMHG
jgi:intein/homing endonuclease